MCLKNDHMFYDRPKWAIFHHNGFISVNKKYLVSFFMSQKID